MNLTEELKEFGRDEYYCYTFDTSDEDARHKFKARYGYEPQLIKRTTIPPMVWAGPVVKHG